MSGSTNDDLAALGRAGAPEGTWLRAECQTAGKGRQGRIWLSPVGNLHASTVVRLQPTDPPSTTLALVAAVALHAALSNFLNDLRIKWPNDLLVDDAKLAGILLEREGDVVIVGFGVNIAEHPEFAERPTTSLKAATGERFEPEQVLAALAEAFSGALATWRGEGLEPIRRKWLEAAHPIGTALVTADGAGQFDGLEPSGALRLKSSDGEIRIIHAGDVFLI